jgi:hypothetical protein
MGNKLGKGRSKWQNEEEVWAPVASFTEAKEIEVDIDVVDLERSRLEDRQQNSMGLPLDVICLILGQVSVYDFRSIALSCKTWRRILLQNDSIWRHPNILGQMEGLKVDLGKPVRPQMLVFLEQSLAADFVYLPSYLSGDAPAFLGPGKLVEAINISMVGFGRAREHRSVGKECILTRLTADVFIEEYDPAYHDTVRKMYKGRLLDMANIQLWSVGMSEPVVQNCDFHLLCSTFESSCLEDLSDQAKLMWKKYNSKGKILVIRTQADRNLPFKNKLKVLEFCRVNELPFISCSAKTPSNIFKIFDTVLEMNEKVKKL